MVSLPLNVHEYKSVHAILEQTKKKIPAIPTESDEEDSGDDVVLSSFDPHASTSGTRDVGESQKTKQHAAALDTRTLRRPSIQLDEYMEIAHQGFLKHEAWVHAAVDLALQLQASRNQRKVIKLISASNDTPNSLNTKSTGSNGAASTHACDNVSGRTLAGLQNVRRAQTVHQDRGSRTGASECAGESWTIRAARLHTQMLVDELCVKAARQEIRENSENGDALLHEIASSELPRAESLWSSDEEV